MGPTWNLPFVVLLGLAGCSSAPKDPPSAASTAGDGQAVSSVSSSEAVPVPDDFSVDITILAAEEGHEAEARNARYVLFPDGTLHYANLPGRGPNTLPPIVRRLNRRQVDELWNRARQLGLTDTSSADEVSNFRKVWSPWEGRVYLFAFTGDGDYWNYTRKVEPGEQLDPALRAFLRNIAALAWADDHPEAEIVFDPKRYDYGPDPYATYRANKAALESSSESQDDQ